MGQKCHDDIVPERVLITNAKITAPLMKRIKEDYEMKRAFYDVVKKGTLVTVKSSHNKGRICMVIYREKSHVVLRTVDGERFYGPRSLDCPLMVWNLHDVELAGEESQ